MRFTGNGFERGKRPFFYLVENYRRRQTLNTREPRSGIGGIGGRAGLKARMRFGEGTREKCRMHAEKFSPGGAVRDGPGTGRILWTISSRLRERRTSFFPDRLLQRPIPRCRSFSGSYLDNLIKRSENHKILLKSYIFQKKSLTL
ncbi:hypothetical protein B4135_1433 [Caldibacillus debilis]|uniref:Uncharacterized protein n=1 Tax=Caldibacillus debilis TaxID=301148 RepID=A0A150MCF8_9BACI|nr:hypothetical protein B4135_1433 [Caldibacillus debilis]